MYTNEQLAEIAAIVTHITTLTRLLTEEGKVPLADRLISTDNITNINSNIEEFSDYLASLVPPAV